MLCLNTLPKPYALFEVKYMHDKFQIIFGVAPDWQGFTPGRVNLIGEHVDYNGGRVLPTALHLGVNIAISQRTDKLIRIKAEGFDGITERPVGDSIKNHWSDYIIGAANLAYSQGLIEKGLNVAVSTNLPVGSGLSSSAAIIVGLLDGCNTLSKGELSRLDLAIMARSVETDYIGVPVGIMDQMAVAIANSGQALSLDTHNLNYSLIDLPCDYHMAVIHSGVHRQLNEGRYKIRKEECDHIKIALNRKDICQMSDQDLATLTHLPENIYRRARHVMTEHRRVEAASQALEQKDMVKFGTLMKISHLSMRDDFEMSVPQIDALVESANSLGALGARLTGGGFGGCIVACIAKSDLKPWKDALLANHPNAYWVC